MFQTSLIHITILYYTPKRKGNSRDVLDVSVRYQLHTADIKYETSYLCLFPALNLLYKLYNTQTMFKHI